MTTRQSTDNIVFENKIKVKINGANIELDNAPMNFTINRNNEKEPNTCSLNIYNLNDVDIAKLYDDIYSVEIYTNQYDLRTPDGELIWENVFTGMLREVLKPRKPSKAKKPRKSKKSATPRYYAPSVQYNGDEPDTYITLELQEGNAVETSRFISRSYKSGQSAFEIIKDLARNLDMPVMFIGDLKDTTLNFNIPMYNIGLNCLHKMARYLDAKVTIVNGNIYFAPNSTTGSRIVHKYDEDNIPTPQFKEDKKIQIETIFTPEIIPNEYVYITNKILGMDAGYRVLEVEHSFSNHDTESSTTLTLKDN